MPKVHLRVILPRNRNKTGWLRLEVDEIPVAEYRCLGRGSRGPGDTTLLHQGNTPPGSYSASEIVDTSGWPRKSYGPWGAVRLKATGGVALLASKFGRGGILIHGGSLGGASYWRGQGSLRATYGCLRMSNADVKDLIDRIYIASESSLHGEETAIQVTVLD